MGENVVDEIQKLRQLPDGLHWFCPRQSHEDDSTFYDEDRPPQSSPETDDEKQARLKAIYDADDRKATVLEALPIFAFDGPEAKGYQRWLEERLDSLLSTCDVCVRMYHKARATLKANLAGTYDEEDVDAFMERFDSLNVERIAKHLDSATEKLKSLPPEKRKLQVLGQAEMFAIFEVLSCEPFLASEELLSKHFDQPFALIQSKKWLKLASLVPASTAFLFYTNEIRNGWAVSCWDRLRKVPSKDEFEWCIRGPLMKAMMRVQMTGLEYDFLPLFWKGSEKIVSHLDKKVITEGLRAMDLDIYKLALDHLPIETDAFPHVIGTIEELLKKSPTDFWESMGSVAPPAIVDQFFNSPNLQRLLIEGPRTEDGKTTLSLVDVFSWVQPFVSSLKSQNQPPVCRSFCHHFLGRCQAEKYPQETKTACLQIGLKVILLTLNALIVDFRKNSPASLTDALDIVYQYIDTILAETHGVQNGGTISETAQSSLQIVEKALSLDCLVLRLEHEMLKRNGQLGQERHARTAGLWQQVTSAIGSNEQALASYALRGSRELVGLERIVAKKDVTLSKDAQQFNSAFAVLCGQVGGILDRINERFSAYNMAGLFRSPHLALGVVYALVLSDESARQSAVDLLKNLSGESARRDAFASVLKSAYYSTLSALNDVIRLVTSRRVFTPVSTMLRFATDVVDVICDSQDGLLRSLPLSDADVKATWEFWEYMWAFLQLIFEKTEDWGDVGYPKELLVEFCRDTMQFADRLFNEYSVFVDKLSEDGKEKESLDKLLQHPKNVTEKMVKWVRLRDEFLITTILALVVKLLAKLKELEILVSDETLVFLEGVISKEIKTKLTLQQFAELSRAIDNHTGEVRSPPPEMKALSRKQATMDSWMKAGKASESDMSDDTAKVIRDSTQNAERYKQQLAERKAANAAAIAAKKTNRDVSTIRAKQNAEQTAQKQADFKNKRQAEREALAKQREAAAARARALRGEVQGGTVLNGLGTKGKDHSAKGTGMMVESDESSSSDGDDMDSELFGIPKTVKRDQALQGKGFEFAKDMPLPRAPVKVKRMVRSVKDMRARLAPDLSQLHKTILSWNYYHPGQLPPGSESHQYSTVPGKFRDPAQYKQVFQPLLLLEAWQSFVNAREQSLAPYEVNIVSRGNVDALVEVSTTVSHQVNKDQHVSEGDIVLFSKQKSASSEAPSCLARIHKIKRRKQALEVVYRVAPGNPMISSLIPNQTIHAMKIQSLTPLEREFGALQGLQYYDLCDYICSAEPSNLLSYSDKILTPIEENYMLNKAQAKAVKSALDNDAFTLIQGPPGSGKTKTIVATVGALLTNSLREVGKPMHQPVNHPNQPGGVDRAPVKKLLVCAPSNAAVDELVMRLKEGVRTMSGQERKIKVVRLGRSDAINANVQDVTLEELVNAKLQGTTNSTDQRAETQKLMKEHQAVSEKLREARAQLDGGEVQGPAQSKLQDELNSLIKKKKELSTKIDDAKDKEGAATRQADLERRRAQQQVLDDAHVICATLSGSGHDMFQSLNIEFETVIVDEAAQCVEMSVLIPLKYGCAKCILVGDPKQLPPTVFSREAAEYQYEQSLFVRMQRNHPKAVHLLDTQYRMHPEISLFPSTSFYDSRLLDGPDMAKLRQRPWHANTLYSPYWFFDVAGQHQSQGHSLINRAEIELASQLYARLTSQFGKNYDFKNKIGIITPYKSQLRELKFYFSSQYGKEILETVEFNTTDAFQGRESEIIIFSCVRASPTGGIGFLQDIRRMNVGLTRAKSSLWVLGNASTLAKGEFWGKLIKDAKSRDRFLEPHAYAESVRSGKPLSGSFKPMTAKPRIKTEVKDEDMRSPSPAIKQEPSQHKPQEIKQEFDTGVKQERRAHIKAETPDESDAYDPMDVDSKSDDQVSAKQAYNKSNVTTNGTTDMLLPDPKPIIRKRPTPSNDAGGVLVKKKKKVGKAD